MSNGDVISVSAKCFNRSEVVRKLMEERVLAGLEECADLLKERAREYCPVDTGALQESIDTAVVGNYVVIYAGGDSFTHKGTDKHVDYAEYVEYGTSRTPAQPFMRTAKENHADEVKRIMDNAIIGK